MSFMATFSPIIIAALLGGSSAGLLGVYIMGMRMPFLAIATAHAALAGAVFGDLLGFDHTYSGFAGALIGALLLGWILRKRTMETNAALGTIFSLTMGLAFLGIGLSEGPKSAALGLMWGSLLFVTEQQLIIMGIVAALLVLFVTVFQKELKVLLFSRVLANALLPEGIVFLLLLILSACVITINLETVGGLLLYSLVCNPAIAALKIARGYRSALIISSLLGAFSALGGFAAAYIFDLPVGACIVLISSLLVCLFMLFSKRRRSYANLTKKLRKPD